MDIRFATTGVETETSNLRVRRDWKYKNNILMYPLAYQSARRCGMSSGHSFRNDRSGAETSNLRVPAGLENTKIISSCTLLLIRARDVAECPVDIRFATTGAERRPRTFESRRGSKTQKRWYPIGYHLFVFLLERETGLEPAASTLARSRSTN